MDYIYSAIIKKKKLKMSYYSLSGDEIKRRVVHPYVVIFYSGFAYLIAYCERRSRVFNFKVIRIKKNDYRDDEFEKKKDFKLEEIITTGYGFVNDKCINVKLKIDFPKSIRIKEKVIVKNQEIELLEDKSIIFTANMTSKKEIKEKLKK